MSVYSSRVWLFAKFLCPWDFTGTNTGVDCHFLLQGIFQTQGWNLNLLYFRWILYHWATWGSPQQKDNTHKIHLQDLALDVLWEIFLLSFPWEKQPADTPRKWYTTLWVIWEDDIKTLGKIREPFYLKITLTCWKGQLSSEVITLQWFMLK